MARERDREGPPTRLYTFQIVIETEAERAGYTAYSPTLPGCFRRGATIEEAKERIRQAIRERVETLLATGEPIAQCERLLHVEELSMVLPDKRREAGSRPSSDPHASPHEKR
jgi:predicted RNase H-like HicB family nuclease